MDAARAKTTLEQLRDNLLAGLSLATGRPVERENFHVSFDQGLWLFVVLIGLKLLITYIGTDQPALINSYGLNYLGAIYLFDALLMLVIARLASADLAQTGGLLVANLAATPIYLIAAHLLHHYSEANAIGLMQAWALFLLPITWQLYILIRLLRLFVKIRIGRALLLSLFNIGLGISSLWFLPQSELWYTDQPEAEDSSLAKLYRLSVEDLFYDQRPLMQASLQGLAEQRPGVTDLYLLTLGGYGLQKVFLNEVEYVKALFDERFDTRERSLILANNVETVDRYPLANRHNLRTALTTIGERMDPQEDILFLFMTSHGSHNHRFSVSFGPVPLDDMTPQQVRQALDDAGIRWRVILVSSCYSGGFIEPLKDPQTLVITAAGADRKSFGCGATSEFTDFGTAYFKHALAQQRDFISAFDLADAWVSKKEQREQREASQPQLFIGEAIAERLAAFYRRFDDLTLLTREGNNPDDCDKATGEGLCSP